MAGELEVARSAGQRPELHVNCINLPHCSQPGLSPHTELLFRSRPEDGQLLFGARPLSDPLVSYGGARHKNETQ